MMADIWTAPVRFVADDGSFWDTQEEAEARDRFNADRKAKPSTVSQSEIMETAEKLVSLLREVDHIELHTSAPLSDAVALLNRWMIPASLDLCTRCGRQLDSHTGCEHCQAELDAEENPQ